MINKRFFGGVALLATFCSCSSELDDTSQISTDDGKIKFTAQDFQYVDESRTAFNITENGAEFTWAEKDTVGIFPDKGDQVSFPMTSGAGTKTATFDGGGWALKASSTYASYYPFKRDMTLDKTAIPVSYKGQKQVGNGSTAHLGIYDFMAAKATTANNGGVSFNYEHLGCMIQFNVTMKNAGAIKSLSLSSNEKVFIENGTYDLMSEEIILTAKEFSNSNSIEIEDITTTNENLSATIYMMINPCDLSNKPLKVKLTDSNGNEDEAIINGIKFTAGKAYRFFIDFDNSELYEYTVKTPGSLSSMISESTQKTITKLKINGALNGNDIDFFRKLTTGENTNIKLLDLSDASVINGGGYTKDHYTYSLDGKNYGLSTVEGRTYGMFTDTNCDRIILFNNITELEQYAFYNSKIKHIDIPTSVTKIGIQVFTKCENLKSIILPEGITELNRTFEGSHIEYVSIPKTITRSNEAFKDCSTLKQIKINEGAVLDGAFVNCIGLESVEIPKNVSINGAFNGCTSLKTVEMSEGIKSLRETFIGCSKLESIHIPSTITYMNKAFKGCVNLKVVNIPSGVTDLDYAFEGCTALTSIDIPSTIKTMDYAFKKCTSLNNVTIAEGVKDLSYSFTNCTSLKTIFLPKYVENLNSTFSGCTSLETINIPSTVKYNMWTFDGCKNLKNVIIEEGVKDLSYTFDGCTSLTEIVIPQSVTSMGGAFYGCTSLSKINIPSNVTYLGYTFYGCTRLKEVTCSIPEPVEIDENTFMNVPASCTIYVPASSVYAYETADYWNNYNIQ